MHDLVIVGAGPAGSRLAARAAGAGLRTLLLEEHDEVGSPVHCTGIVGEAMRRRYDLPERLVVGELPRFQVVSPGGRRFALPGVRAWLLNRRDLDRHLAERAVEAGADLELGAEVKAVEAVGDHVEVHLCNRRVPARAAVLATGAMTNLPSRSGLAPPPAFLRTAQVAVELGHPDGVELFLGRRLASGSFAYAVSAAGEPSRLGAIARSDPGLGLRRLMSELRRAGRLRDIPTRLNCRRIPMGVSPRTVRGRILSVGDAAGQTKTTTGGGLHFGMACADLLADVLLGARVGGDFMPDRLQGYDRLWKARFRAELRAGSRVRKIFEYVDDSELEELAGLLELPEVQRVIAEEGDFDCHRPLLDGLTRLPSVRRAAVALTRRRFPGASLLARLYVALREAPESSWRELAR